MSLKLFFEVQMKLLAGGILSLIAANSMFIWAITHKTAGESWRFELMVYIFISLCLLTISSALFFVNYLDTVKMKKRDSLLSFLLQTRCENLEALEVLEMSGSPVLDVLKEISRLDVLVLYKAHLRAVLEKTRARARLDEPNTKGAGRFFSNLAKELLLIEALPTWKEMEAEEEFQTRIKRDTPVTDEVSSVFTSGVADAMKASGGPQSTAGVQN